VYTSGGTSPLKTLSRVSKAWRPRSQNNIFKKFRLDCATMRRIHSESTQTTDRTENKNTSERHPPIVFSYVRKLRVVAKELTSPENDSGSEEGGGGGYLEILRFFTNVVSLRLLDWDFREFETHHMTHFFAHFGATVQNLKIRECYVDSEVLIFLTSLFRRVDNLEVDPRYPCSALTYRIQKSDRPLGSVKFQGNLTFRFLSAQHEEFLAFVNENCLDVRSMSAELCMNKGELQKLFRCRGGNLTSAGVHSLWKQELIDLSPCTQLRTLSIHLLGDFKHDDPNWDSLSTITSPYLEEIKICSFDGSLATETPIGWEATDDLLCQQYDRSYRNGVGNFRVSLHPTEIDSMGEYADLLSYALDAWPKFSKKGSVTMCPELYDEGRNLTQVE